MVGLTVIVGQRVVNGLHAVQVFLALADIAETAHAVLAFHAQLFFQRLYKGAKHVHQQAFAVIGNHCHHFLIDQSAKDNRLLAFHFACVVDLAHRLMGLVYRVYKWNAHDAWLDIELGHQSRTKSLGGDPCAVRNNEYGARVHG